MTGAPGGVARIATAFARARGEGRTPLVLYLTASDPDFDTSLRLVLAAADAGVDVIELGVPWSDPSADGLAIQGAMSRALKAGGGLQSALELTRRIRAVNQQIPIVLFGYANPIVVRGPDAYARAAAQAGADGTLCVDWPADEDRELPDALAAHGLAFVPLLAPTSTASRIDSALAVASGFIYYVSLTGITGAALTDFSGVGQHVSAIRSQVGGRLPVVVGFGIKGGGDARKVAAFADGVVVGSAAIKTVEEAVARNDDPADALQAYVTTLKLALTRA